MDKKDKFNSCKHRSKENHLRKIPYCCGFFETEGYQCYKRNIFKLSAYACEDCQEYEKGEGQNS